MRRLSLKRKALYRKFARGYIGCICLPLLVLAFSLAQGGGWKPVLVGMPAYLTFFAGITYQFIKEFRALGREERGEPEPPPKRGPWDEE